MSVSFTDVLRDPDCGSHQNKYHSSLPYAIAVINQFIIVIDINNVDVIYDVKLMN